jgi:pimeloyl-ACP methyl ester carboxylesterase
VTWPHDDWWSPQSIATSDGTRLAVRVHEGSRRPVMLVHGLASNALLWRDVSESLAGRDHAVAVVDLRGHGRSEQPEHGYDTEQAARDICEVRDHLGWINSHPILAGQSWGGNVAVRATSGDPAWGGLLCVDGGWIYLEERFPTFEQCWDALEPPGFGEATPDQVVEMISSHLHGWPPHALAAVLGNLEVHGARVRNRLSRAHHRSIVASLWRDDPARDYPLVTCPVHLMVAGRTSSPDVSKAETDLAEASVTWYPDAHHDIHLQHPELVVEQLALLLGRVQGSLTS